MRTSKHLIILIGLLAVITAGDCFAKSISVQIREGIYKEQMEGDIDGAIAIYQKVLETDAVNKRYAAEANYRIGLCMIKKGDKAGAAGYFNKVMKDFADQRPVVLKAKRELSKLGVGEISSNIPVILNTSPVAFANDVSPELNKITVTFDRKMMDGSWSWTGSGDTYPEITGKIHYDASRTTCTMPVKLKPGKVYWVGINSPSHKNFKTPDRKAAKWYIILFTTKNAQGNPTPIPADMLERAKAINAKSGNRVVEQWKRVFIADADLPDRNVILDLHSGELLPAGTGIEQLTKFREMGKGDLAYDRFLIALRGTKLYQAEGAEFVEIQVEDAVQDMSVYKVVAPMQAIAKTPEGRQFEIVVESIKDTGINLKYRVYSSNISNSQASPQATVEAFLKAVLSKSRKAKFYIDAGSAIIHQLKDFPELVKDQKLTVETVYSDSSGAMVFTSKLNTESSSSPVPSGQLEFTLEKQRGLWFITDIDFEDAEGAKDDLDRFLKYHPTAKEVEVTSTAVISMKADKAPVASKRKLVNMAHDDGKSAGKRSIAGGGHAVRFSVTAGSTLEGIRIYGSRYGGAKAPNEQFSVWLCDTGYNTIKEFKFPYSKFAKRGHLNWVNLKTATTALPDEFIICVGFNPEQTKGVYVHHDRQSSGNSLSGLPGNMKPFEQGDWMIRAVVKTATKL